MMTLKRTPATWDEIVDSDKIKILRLELGKDKIPHDLDSLPDWIKQKVVNKFRAISDRNRIVIK